VPSARAVSPNEDSTQVWHMPHRATRSATFPDPGDARLSGKCWDSGRHGVGTIVDSQ
jgi:hypothetical protein